MISWSTSEFIFAMIRAGFFACGVFRLLLDQPHHRFVRGERAR